MAEGLVLGLAAGMRITMVACGAGYPGQIVGAVTIMASVTMTGYLTVVLLLIMLAWQDR